MISERALICSLYTLDSIYLRMVALACHCFVVASTRFFNWLWLLSGSLQARYQLSLLRSHICNVAIVSGTSNIPQISCYVFRPLYYGSPLVWSLFSDVGYWA